MAKRDRPRVPLWGFGLGVASFAFFLFVASVAATDCQPRGLGGDIALRALWIRGRQQAAVGQAGASSRACLNHLKVETRFNPKLRVEMSLKKWPSMVGDSQGKNEAASTAGPARDTCRPDLNRKPSNRPLTCGFSRGAGRT